MTPCFEGVEDNSAEQGSRAETPGERAGTHETILMRREGKREEAGRILSNEVDVATGTLMTRGDGVAGIPTTRGGILEKEVGKVTTDGGARILRTMMMMTDGGRERTGD